MIDFPDAPTVNQLFSAVGKFWRWDGEKWGATSGSTIVDETYLVTSTTTLPAGFNGFVEVKNTTGAAITITLPPSPNPSQGILIKDNLGNASQYPITVLGGGANIEGQLFLIIRYDWGWLDLLFLGSQWGQT